MDRYALILRRLIDEQVRFVLIGGYAAVLHGADYVTKDVDLCAPLDVANLQRIINALKGLNPIYRFHVKRIPLHEDAKDLGALKNLYLQTDLGFLDILGEVAGIGTFDEVLSRSTVHEFFGTPLNIIEIDALIDSKRAAGREKDKLGIAQLEAVRRARANEATDPG